MALGSGSGSLGTLTLHIEADTRDFDTKILQVEKRAAEAGKRMSRYLGGGEMFKGLDKPLSVNVDHKSLQELNAHLDLKRKHLHEVINDFRNNPIIAKFKIEGQEALEHSKATVESLSSKQVGVSVTGTGAALSEMDAIASKSLSQTAQIDIQINGEKDLDRVLRKIERLHDRSVKINVATADYSDISAPLISAGVRRTGLVQTGSPQEQALTRALQKVGMAPKQEAQLSGNAQEMKVAVSQALRENQQSFGSQAAATVVSTLVEKTVGLAIEEGFAKAMLIVSNIIKDKLKFLDFIGLKGVRQELTKTVDQNYRANVYTEQGKIGGFRGLVRDARKVATLPAKILAAPAAQVIEGFYGGIGQAYARTFASGSMKAFKQRTGKSVSEIGENANQGFAGRFTGTNIVEGLVSRAGTIKGAQDYLEPKVRTAVTAKALQTADPTGQIEKTLQPILKRYGFKLNTEPLRNADPEPITNAIKKISTALRDNNIKADVTYLGKTLRDLATVIKESQKEISNATPEQQGQKQAEADAARAQQVGKVLNQLEETARRASEPVVANYKQEVAQAARNLGVQLGQTAVDETKRVDDSIKTVAIVSGGFAGMQGQAGARQAPLYKGILGDETKIVPFDNKDFDTSKPAQEGQAAWLRDIAGLMARNVSKGYNPASIQMAQEAAEYKMANPGVDLQLIGHSAGGIIVKEAQKMLREIGIEAKAIALGSPTVRDMAFQGKSENFLSFMADKDMLNPLTGESAARIPGIESHSIDEYLSNSAVQAVLKTVNKVGISPKLIEILNKVGTEFTDLDSLTGALNQHMAEMGIAAEQAAQQIQEIVAIAQPQPTVAVRRYAETDPKQAALKARAVILANKAKGIVPNFDPTQFGNAASAASANKQQAVQALGELQSTNLDQDLSAQGTSDLRKIITRLQGLVKRAGQEGSGENLAELEALPLEELNKILSDNITAFTAQPPNDYSERQINEFKQSLQQFTVKDLQDIGKKSGLSGISQLNKDPLIDQLSQAENVQKVSEVATEKALLKSIKDAEKRTTQALKQAKGAKGDDRVRLLGEIRNSINEQIRTIADSSERIKTSEYKQELGGTRGRLEQAYRRTFNLEDPDAARASLQNAITEQEQPKGLSAAYTKPPANFQRLVASAAQAAGAKVDETNQPELVEDDVKLLALGAKAFYDFTKNQIIVSRRTAEALKANVADLHKYETELGEVIHEVQHAADLGFQKLDPKTFGQQLLARSQDVPEVQDSQLSKQLLRQVEGSVGIYKRQNPKASPQELSAVRKLEMHASLQQQKAGERIGQLKGAYGNTNQSREEQRGMSEATWFEEVLVQFQKFINGLKQSLASLMKSFLGTSKLFSGLASASTASQNTFAVLLKPFEFFLQKLGGYADELEGVFDTFSFIFTVAVDTLMQKNALFKQATAKAEQVYSTVDKAVKNTIDPSEGLPAGTQVKEANLLNKYRSYNFESKSGKNVGVHFTNKKKGSDVFFDINGSMSTTAADELTQKEKDAIALKVLKIIKHDAKTRKEGYTYRTEAFGDDDYGAARAEAYEKLGGFSRPVAGEAGAKQYAVVQNGKLAPDIKQVERREWNQNLSSEQLSDNIRKMKEMAAAQKQAQRNKYKINVDPELLKPRVAATTSESSSVGLASAPNRKLQQSLEILTASIKQTSEKIASHVDLAADKFLTAEVKQRQYADAADEIIQKIKAIGEATETSPGLDDKEYMSYVSGGFAGVQGYNPKVYQAVEQMLGEKHSVTPIFNRDYDSEASAFEDPFKAASSTIEKIAQGAKAGVLPAAKDMAEIAYANHLRNPDKKVRFVGHSGGAHVASEALEIFKKLAPNADARAVGIGGAPINQRTAGLKNTEYANLLKNDDRLLRAIASMTGMNSQFQKIIAAVDKQGIAKAGQAHTAAAYAGDEQFGEAIRQFLESTEEELENLAQLTGESKSVFQEFQANINQALDGVLQSGASFIDEFLAEFKDLDSLTPQQVNELLKQAQVAAVKRMGQVALGELGGGVKGVIGIGQRLAEESKTPQAEAAIAVGGAAQGKVEEASAAAQASVSQATAAIAASIAATSQNLAQKAEQTQSPRLRAVYEALSRNVAQVQGIAAKTGQSVEEIIENIAEAAEQGIDDAVDLAMDDYGNFVNKIQNKGENAKGGVDKLVEVGQTFIRDPRAGLAQAKGLAGDFALDKLKQKFPILDQLASKFGLVKQAAGAFIGLFVGGMLINAAVQFMNKIGFAAIEVATRFENLERIIRFTSGSASEAARNIEFVQGLADKFSINPEKALSGFAQMSAAALETPLQGEGVKNVQGAISQASAVYSLAPEQQERVFMALNQMISKGTVSSEELRQQLGESLPGALNIAARSMGVTTSEFNKMLEQGQVLSEDFLPRFASQLSAETAGGVAGAANSAQAKINRFGNSVLKAQAILGKGLMPVKNFGLDVFTGLLNGLAKILPIVAHLFGAVLFAGVLQVGKSFIELAGNPMVRGAAWQALSMGVRGLGTAFKMMLPMLAQFARAFIVFTALTEGWKMLQAAMNDSSGESGEWGKRLTDGLDNYKKALAEARGETLKFKEVREETLLDATFLGGLMPKQIDQDSSFGQKAGYYGGKLVTGAITGTQRLLGLDTYEDKKLADQQIATGNIRTAANESISSTISTLSGKELAEVKAADKELRDLQIKRRGLSETNPQDKAGMRAIKEQETAAIKRRDAAQKPIAALQAQNQNVIDGLKFQIEEYEKKALEPGKNQEFYKESLGGLKGDLEAAYKWQEKLNQSVGETVNAFTLMQRQLQNIVDRLADANDRTQMIGASAKADLFSKAASGDITQGQLDYGQGQIDRAVLGENLKNKQNAIAAMMSSLESNDSQKILEARGINNIEEVGQAEITTLAGKAKEGTPEKEVLTRLAEVKKMQTEIPEMESQLQQAQAQAAQQIRDANKQIGDYFRDVSRQAADLALSSKEAGMQIAMQSEKNRLKNKLGAFQDTFFSSFVDYLIEGVDTLNEPLQASLEREREVQQAEFARQDRDRQAVDIAKSLPLDTQAIKLDFSAIDSAPVKELQKSLQESAIAGENVTKAAKGAGAAIGDSAEQADVLGGSFGEAIDQVAGIESATGSVGDALQDNISQAQGVNAELMNNRNATDENRVAVEGVNDAVLQQELNIGASTNATFGSAEATNVLQHAWAFVTQGVADTAAKTWEWFTGLGKNVPFLNQFGEMIAGWSKNIQGLIAKTWEWFQGLFKNIPFLQQIGQTISGWGQSVANVAGGLVGEAGHQLDRLTNWAGGGGKVTERYRTGTLAAQEYAASRDGGSRRHAGQDIDVSGNQEAQSFIGGVVTRVVHDRDGAGYGSYVDVYNKALGVVERIAEVLEVNVKEGQEIKAGQAIGRGESHTGVFHYEIRKPVDAQGRGGYGFEGTEDPIKFYEKLGIAKREGNDIKILKGMNAGQSLKASEHGVGDGHNHFGEDDIKKANQAAAKAGGSLQMPSMSFGGGAGATGGGSGLRGGTLPQLRAGYSSVQKLGQEFAKNKYFDPNTPEGRSRLAIAMATGGSEVYSKGSTATDFFTRRGGTDNNMLGALQYNLAYHSDKVDTPQEYTNFSGEIFAGKRALPNGRQGMDFGAALNKAVASGQIKSGADLERWMRSSGLGGSNWQGVDDGFGRVPGLTDDLVKWLSTGAGVSAGAALSGNMNTASAAPAQQMPAIAPVPFASMPGGESYSSTSVNTSKLTAAQAASAAMERKQKADAIAREQSRNKNAIEEGKMRQERALEERRRALLELDTNRVQLNRQFEDANLDNRVQTPQVEAQRGITNTKRTYEDLRKDTSEKLVQAKRGRDQAAGVLSELTSPNYKARPGQDVAKDIEATQRAIAAADKYIADLEANNAKIQQLETDALKFKAEMAAREKKVQEDQEKLATENVSISVLEAEADRLKGMRDRGVRDQGVEKLPKLEAEIAARREEAQLKGQIADLDEKIFKNQDNQTVVAELNKQKAGLTDRLGIVKKTIEANRAYSEEVMQRENNKINREANNAQSQQELETLKQQLSGLQQLVQLNPLAPGTDKIAQLEEAIALKELEIKLTNDLAAAEQERFENKINPQQYEARVKSIKEENEQAKANINFKRKQADAESAIVRARAALATREQDSEIRGSLTEARSKNIDLGGSESGTGDSIAMRFQQQADQQKLSFDKQMIDLDELANSGKRTKEEIDALRLAYVELNRISLENLATEQKRATEDRNLAISGKMVGSSNALLDEEAARYDRFGFGKTGDIFREQSAIASQGQAFAEAQVELERFIGSQNVSVEKAAQLRGELAQLNQVKLDGIQESFSPLKDVISGTAGSFKGLFTDLLSGTKTVGEAFKSFLDSILSNLANLAAEFITNELFSGLLGGNKKSGGGGGGIMGLLGGLMGGGGSGGGMGGGLGFLSAVPNLLGIFHNGGTVGDAAHIQAYASGGSVSGCGCRACAMARGGMAGSGIEESLEAAMKREKSMNGGRPARVIVATEGEFVVPVKVASRLTKGEKNYLLGQSAPNRSTPSYSQGGFVGNMGSTNISERVTNMNGSTKIEGSTVNVNGEGGGSMSAQEARAMQAAIDQRVTEVVSKMTRPRGLLYR